MHFVGKNIVCATVFYGPKQGVNELRLGYLKQRKDSEQPNTTATTSSISRMGMLPLSYGSLKGIAKC